MKMIYFTGMVFYQVFSCDSATRVFFIKHASLYVNRRFMYFKSCLFIVLILQIIGTQINYISISLTNICLFVVSSHCFYVLMINPLCSICQVDRDM